ncbi:hypothetical protein EJ05DRAFT_487966 [Pseudovirgaria hyperparasitica]|uniref:Uncharacterized protein n=1 Tax=Pseudovirgaria hyperparasitica TaxID=470096 RepID=A0A6A6VZS0_9PEZI|nr:uncharacterized protein EJ05DRAFT_487966 [Pseudovirgaria hyperparasitica]KAF2756168.1 hypothetical protein EJ05DRAFT_487966 [Pseudovirgaria hyperparasitica]
MAHRNSQNSLADSALHCLRHARLTDTLTTFTWCRASLCSFQEQRKATIDIRIVIYFSNLRRTEKPQAPARNRRSSNDFGTATTPPESNSYEEKACKKIPDAKSIEMPQGFENVRRADRISSAATPKVRQMNKVTKQRPSSHIRIVHAVKEPAARSPASAPTSASSLLEPRRANRNSTNTTDREANLSPFLPLDWDYRRVHSIMPGHFKTESNALPNAARKETDSQTQCHAREDSYGWILKAQEVVLPPRQSSKNWRSEDSDSSTLSSRSTNRSSSRNLNRVTANRHSNRNWQVFSNSSTPTLYSSATFVESDSDSDSSNYSPYSSSSSISTPTHSPPATRPRPATATFVDSDSESEDPSPTPKPTRKHLSLAYLAPAITPSAPAVTQFTPTPSPPLSPTISPTLSPTLSSFDASLRPGHITRLVFWYLYYDLIEPPASPTSWYAKIPAWELQGWIALGRAFTSNPDLPFPSTLSTIIQALRLDAAELKYLIIRLADKTSMRTTETKELVDLGRAQGLSSRAVAMGIREKFVKDRRLLEALFVKGQGAGELWGYMQFVLLRRVADYLDYVILPHVGGGATAAAKGGAAKGDGRAREGVLKSYWRLMGVRKVPAEWYEGDGEEGDGEREMGDWETVNSFF